MDCTCRLWSARRGEQLFQINLPSPVTHIQVDHQSSIYCSCLNRLIVFRTESLFKEEELPSFWQDTNIKDMISTMRKKSQPALALQKQIDHSKQGVTIPELQKLIAHGLLMPHALETMISQFQDIDAEQIYRNMKRYRIPLRQMQRVIANNAKYHPRDLLHALGTKNRPGIIYALISKGAPLSGLMNKLGYNMVRVNDNIQIFLNDEDIDKEGIHRDTARSRAVGGVAWLNNEEDNEYDPLDDELGSFDPMQTTGKILHFIPSEQRKLIKDLHSKNGIQPIFLRSLAAAERKEGAPFPNFDPDRVPEDIGFVNRAMTGTVSERFNER